MHLKNLYCPTPKSPPYETLGNITASGDPDLADAWVAFDYGDGGFDKNYDVIPGPANDTTAEYLIKNAISQTYDPSRPEGQRKVHIPKAPLSVEVLVGKALLQACPTLQESSQFTIVGDRAGYYGLRSRAAAKEARESIPWARTKPARELTPNQEQRQSRGMPLGRIAIAAPAQKVERLVRETQQVVGKTAEVYRPRGLSNVYAGPDSTQISTTHPFFWWPREVGVRVFNYLMGGPLPSDEDINKAIENTARVCKRVWNFLKDPR